MMRNAFTLFACLFILAGLQAQNVGINTTNPQAALDVNGDIILRSADVSLGTSVTLINPLDVLTNRKSSYRITGPLTNFTIAGITAAADGRVITIYNSTAFTMTVSNEAAVASSANRIKTSTSKDVQVYAGGSIDLQYYSNLQRWQVNGAYNDNSSGGGASLWQSGDFDRIYNSNTGNVGIGTSTPFYKLQVAGDADFLGVSSAQPRISFQNTGQGGFKFLGGAFTASSPYSNYQDEQIKISGSQIQSYIRDNQDPTVNDNRGNVSINPLGGNVGIGTNFNPEYKLHVWAGDDKLIKIDGTNSLVLFHDGTSNAQYGFFRTWTKDPFNPAGYYGFEIGTPPSVGNDKPKRLMFSTNYALRMIIMENGVVGIGTTNPSPLYMLSVNGKIRAKEIRVNSDWADYVFEENYQRPSLAEIESFIKEHKHLPGIPSAATIQQNGVDVSDMQAKMMAKIEELTLYMIEANKTIEKLEQKIRIIESKN